MQGNVSRLPEEQAHSQQTMIDKQFLNMTGWSYVSARLRHEIMLLDDLNKISKLHRLYCTVQSSTILYCSHAYKQNHSQKWTNQIHSQPRSQGLF
jgi:hypothetical protein